MNQLFVNFYNANIETNNNDKSLLSLYKKFVNVLCHAIDSNDNERLLIYQRIYKESCKYTHFIYIPQLQQYTDYNNYYHYVAIFSDIDEIIYCANIWKSLIFFHNVERKIKIPIFDDNNLEKIKNLFFTTEDEREKCDNFKKIFNFIGDNMSFGLVTNSLYIDIVYNNCYVLHGMILHRYFNNMNITDNDLSFSYIIRSDIRTVLKSLNDDHEIIENDIINHRTNIMIKYKGKAKKKCIK